MSVFLLVAVVIFGPAVLGQMGHCADKAGLSVEAWLRREFPQLWSFGKAVYDPSRVSLVMGVGGLVVLLWLCIPAFVTGVNHGTQKWGDPFGAVNALFAGLAFVALITTLLLQREQLEMQSEELKLQREELKLNTKELKNQAVALDEQVHLMRISAKLAAIPSLIEAETKIANRYKTIFPEFLPIMLESREELALAVTEIQRIVDMHRFLQVEHKKIAANSKGKMLVRIDGFSPKDASVRCAPILLHSLRRLLRYYDDQEQCYSRLEKLESEVNEAAGKRAAQDCD